MSTEGPPDPYSAVLAELEAQRAKIDVAIAAIKALQTGSPIPASPMGPPAQPSSNHGINIVIDTFHALTTSQAIKKYLGMRRKPASTQEIVEALQAGGQSGSDGANFSVVVNNSLNRMAAADGDVSKVKRGVWGLKAWYDSKAKAE